MKKVTKKKESELKIELPKEIEIDQKVVDEFHKVFYPRHFTATWMGQPMQKNPLDLFMYSEILYECKPDLIVECGTAHGGSALYLAHLCDILQHGQILTVDIVRWVGFPFHPRITYYTGSSIDEKTISDVKNFASGFRKVMVILDSDHSRDHVFKELEEYSSLVTPSQYLIVEDSNVHGHPVREDHPPGPWEAVEKWLPKNEGFMIDKMCERYLLTFNPNGYLRRIK
jgi:cephalosporin hydroxylase